jgi:hypothetical protein
MERNAIEQELSASFKEIPNLVLFGIPALFSTAIPLVSGYLDRFIEFMPFDADPSQGVIFHIVILLFFVLPPTYMMLRMLNVASTVMIVATVLVTPFYVLTVWLFFGEPTLQLVLLLLIHSGATLGSVLFNHRRYRRPIPTKGGIYLSAFLFAMTLGAIYFVGDIDKRSIDRAAFSSVGSLVEAAEDFTRAGADQIEEAESEFERLRLRLDPAAYPQDRYEGYTRNVLTRADSLLEMIPASVDDSTFMAFVADSVTVAGADTTYWVNGEIAFGDSLSWPTDTTGHVLTLLEPLEVLDDLDTRIDDAIALALTDSRYIAYVDSGVASPDYAKTLARGEWYRNILVRERAVREDRMLKRLAIHVEQRKEIHSRLHGLGQSLLAKIYEKTQHVGFWVFFPILLVLLGYYVFAPVSAGKTNQSGGSGEGGSSPGRSQVDYQRDTALLGIAVLALLIPPLMTEVETDSINVKRPVQSFTVNNWYLPTQLVRAVVPTETVNRTPFASQPGVGGFAGNLEQERLDQILVEMSSLINQLDTILKSTPPDTASQRIVIEALGVIGETVTEMNAAIQLALDKDGDG